MTTEAIGATAPAEGDSIAVVHPAPSAAKPIGLHSPPDSNNAVQLDDSDDSELSDLDDAIAEQLSCLDDVVLPVAAVAHADADADAAAAAAAEATTTSTSTGPADDAANPVDVPEEDDIGDVEPDHYSGTVPVFRPTMHQFKDFKKFMEKVDKYGMKSGIIKVIPPQEWKDALPALDELVKTIRVREPIKQDIMGSNGTYRQVNILHQRSYNLPQWRQLCDQSEHQPPARRGERRANADKPKPAPRPRPAAASSASTPKSTPRRSKRGRPGRKKQKVQPEAEEDEATESEQRPMTPESAKAEEDKAPEEQVVESVEQDPKVKIEEEEDDDEAPATVAAAPRRMGFTRQAAAKTQSTSARRKYAKREGSAKIDEAAFRDWDYRMDVSDYTPERCEELERIYWKTLTYAPPLYGADLAGTLFDETTSMWNLNRLPNLLDVLGTKVPGVNTAYLYLGMWKATFAWHLEDVDLYSINYLHFGAPKQWYSISQGDARRFEAAMKNIWPTDAKACDQFLRHKSFLISPQHLQQHYNIRVNKCVSYPGEFVVTYPYGYHSGYNLGYNCAEAVNFALDSWLPMGKIAKKCECAQAQDSVWVDVYEIERKLRGESTEYEVTDYEEDEEEEEDADESVAGAPTPQSGRAIRVKAPSRKRKRPVGEKEPKKTKKIRVRVKAHKEPPCCLCPNDIPGAEILPTDDGRKAHRICALYLPETYIETEDDREIITNAANIEKARLELRCMYCRSKRGACFQCSQKKCARSYHATCAAAAGVFVEEAEVPVFGEDGTEYKEQAFEFTCRFQRTKRDRKLDGDALEKNTRIREAAKALREGQMCQLQYYRGDIFAGVVVENRHDEQMLLLDIIPNGDRVEVEWKWLLLPDPADFRLPKASANALPLPTSRKAKDLINAKKRPGEEPPRSEDVFVEGGFTWAEFHTCEASECDNKEQARLDLSKEDQVWHYLARGSTETKAQFTEDPTKPRYNPKSNFLKSIPKPVVPKPVPPPRRSYSAINPPYVPHSLEAKPEKPYVYKPRKPIDPAAPVQLIASKLGPNGMPLQGVGQQLVFGTDPRFGSRGQFSVNGFAPALPGAAGTTTPGNTALNSFPGQALPAGQSQQRPGPHFPVPNAARPLPAAAPGATTAAPLAPGGISSVSNPPGTAPPSKQSNSLLPPPPIPTQQKPQLSPSQKYPFFQLHHNRDSTRYRTPYAPWGGFTNGYEGNLRAHLMSTQGAKLHRRGSSFGLGGGLRGLIRPSPYLNYSTPPSSSSSSSSPYTSHTAQLGSAAASPSSYSSYDAMMTGNKLGHRSPPHLNNPFAGSPVTPMGPFDMRPPSQGPLHPAIRPQFGPALPWQQDYHHGGVNPFAQAATDVNFSPPSPIRPSGSVLAASPSIQPQALTYGMMAAAPNPPPSFSPPPPPPPPPSKSEVAASRSGDKDTPAEQLKQQLRRISDPPLPSSYSAPHPAIKREIAAHAPVSSQIPAPMPTSTQAPAPKPQQPQPNLYRPAPRPEPDLKPHPPPQPPTAQQQRRNTAPPPQIQQLPRPDSHSVVRRYSPYEVPAVPPARPKALIDQMMINLRRASEMATWKK